VLAASADGTLTCWDAVAGGERGHVAGPGPAVARIAFSGDGGTIVTVAADGTASVRDIAFAAPALRLSTEGAVTDVALSHDGLRVLTAAADGELRVWDARSGTLLAVLEGEAGAERRAALTPDGTKVVTDDKDQTARVFLVDQADLLDLAESRLPRTRSVGA
jgi:WD40 repeat protein